jgi:sugar O-acyltransferase (sialic acid O-acetyltransferase NeuD family)
MKNLIIIGGGGMGRSVYCIAQGCKGYDEEFTIKGFIDDNLISLDGFKGYPPVLDTIDRYEIQPDDVFVCSIGNTRTKRMICEKLKEKGAKFQSLIHKTAIVRQNSIIGEGCIVADYASVGADCKIGESSLIQSYSIVAHDCVIGDYVRIDTHSVCVGGVKIENIATIHTGAVISHNVIVGEGATVAATSFVIKKVKPGTTVWGNPAKLLN